MKGILKSDGSLFGLSFPFMKAGTTVELAPFIAAPGYPPSDKVFYAIVGKMTFVVRVEDVEIIQEDAND